MKQNLESYIEKELQEFRDKYKGILPPEVIQAGVDWYADKLRKVAERSLEAVEGEEKRGDVALGWGELTGHEWGYNQALLELEKKKKEWLNQK